MFGMRCRPVPGCFVGAPGRSGCRGSDGEPRDRERAPRHRPVKANRQREKLARGVVGLHELVPW